jgi:hypothetical protein
MSKKNEFSRVTEGNFPLLPFIHDLEELAIGVLATHQVIVTLAEQISCCVAVTYNTVQASVFDR